MNVYCNEYACMVLYSNVILIYLNLMVIQVMCPYL